MKLKNTINAVTMPLIFSSLLMTSLDAFALTIRWDDDAADQNANSATNYDPDGVPGFGDTFTHDVFSTIANIVATSTSGALGGAGTALTVSSAANTLDIAGDSAITYSVGTFSDTTTTDVITTGGDITFTTVAITAGADVFFTTPATDVILGQTTVDGAGSSLTASADSIIITSTGDITTGGNITLNMATGGTLDSTAFGTPIIVDGTSSATFEGTAGTPATLTVPTDSSVGLNGTIVFENVLLTNTTGLADLYWGFAAGTNDHTVKMDEEVKNGVSAGATDWDFDDASELSLTGALVELNVSGKQLFDGTGITADLIISQDILLDGGEIEIRAMNTAVLTGDMAGNLGGGETLTISGGSDVSMETAGALDVLEIKELGIDIAALHELVIDGPGKVLFRDVDVSGGGSILLTTGSTLQVHNADDATANDITADVTVGIGALYELTNLDGTGDDDFDHIGDITVKGNGAVRLATEDAAADNDLFTDITGTITFESSAGTMTIEGNSFFDEANVTFQDVIGPTGGGQATITLNAEADVALEVQAGGTTLSNLIIDGAEDADFDVNAASSAHVLTLDNVNLNMIDNSLGSGTITFESSILVDNGGAGTTSATIEFGGDDVNFSGDSIKGDTLILKGVGLISPNRGVWRNGDTGGLLDPNIVIEFGSATLQVDNAEFWARGNTIMQNPGGDTMKFEAINGSRFAVGSSTIGNGRKLTIDGIDVVMEDSQIDVFGATGAAAKTGGTMLFTNGAMVDITHTGDPSKSFTEVGRNSLLRIEAGSLFTTAADFILFGGALEIDSADLVLVDGASLRAEHSTSDLAAEPDIEFFSTITIDGDFVSELLPGFFSMDASSELIFTGLPSGMEVMDEDLGPGGFGAADFVITNLVIANGALLTLFDLFNNSPGVPVVDGAVYVEDITFGNGVPNDGTGKFDTAGFEVYFLTTNDLGGQIFDSLDVTVPEPAGIVLMLIGSGWFVRRRRVV